MSKVNKRAQYDEVDILMLRLENVEHRIKLIENMLFTQASTQRQSQSIDPQSSVLQELLESIKAMKHSCEDKKDEQILAVTTATQDTVQHKGDAVDLLRRRTVL